MTPPDGSAADALALLDDGAGRSAVAAFPGVFCDPSPAAPPPDLADALATLAAERGLRAEDLLNAARLLCGGDCASDMELTVRAAELALAAAGRGERRVVATAEIDRLRARAEMHEYRSKALADSLARVAFQPLKGGVRDVREAAQIFGFANEWCFDEDRVTRRFRELAPVYHPDTGVAADRERMTQLIEARNLLLRHVRTAYASGEWARRRA